MTFKPILKVDYFIMVVKTVVVVKVRVGKNSLSLIFIMLDLFDQQ